MFIEPSIRNNKKGWIEVVCGSMFSGKTEELIRRLRRAQFAKMKVEIFKPMIDTRYDSIKIVSHNSTSIMSTPISNSSNILLLASGVEVVGIDEAQFFTDLVEFCKKWTNYGKIMIIAGLSGDYKQESFAPISNIMPLADKIIHLTSNCSLCGADAPFTKRLIENNDQIVVGNDIYQPRCRNCL
jgi:thymidine kinase